MSKEMGDHWAGVPVSEHGGKALSPEAREVFRARLDLWPEAHKIGKAAGLSEQALWNLASEFHSTHRSTWREQFLARLVDMRDHPEQYRNRKTFFGGDISVSRARLDKLLDELLPEALLGVLNELVQQMEKRKADSKRKGDYRGGAFSGGN